MLQLPLSLDCKNKIESQNWTKDDLTRLDCVSVSVLAMIQKITELIDSGIELDELEQHANNSLSHFTGIARNDIEVFFNIKQYDYFDVPTLIRGFDLLSQQDIDIMDQQVLDDKEYLTDAGIWDTSYKNKEPKGLFESKYFTSMNKTCLLTAEQDKVAGIIKAERDESLHIEGVAGCGKSSFIAHLTATLNPNRTLLLTENMQQREVLLSRTSFQATVMTFGYLAKQILSRIDGAPMSHVSRNDNYQSFSYGKLADEIGCYELGQYNKWKVAQLAYDTVKRFCFSGESYITINHVDKNVTDADKKIIASLAEKYWGQLCEPNPNLNLPIRDYHAIKALVLNHYTLNDYYKHIIVDEAHDLSIPVRQFLDTSPQMVVTLGDTYQSFNNYRNNQYQYHHRKRHFNHSVRLGENVSGIFNNLINQHPVQPDVDFHGTTSKKTEINTYEIFSFPDKPTAILTDGIWQVFELVQKMSHENIPFKLLSRTRTSLSSLITSAIDLYTGKPQNSTHAFFYGVNSWSEYLNNNNNVFMHRVNKILKNGYDHNRFKEIMANEVSSESKAHLVACIEDTKNMEFKRVMLYRKMRKRENQTDESKSRSINRLYTGLSRSYSELIVPSYIHDGMY